MFLPLDNNQRHHVRKEVNAMLFSPKEKGQGMVEYALIIVLIAIVVIIVLTVLGTQISTVFSQISSALAT
jgi:pilus assembly protein Flp/PilA